MPGLTKMRIFQVQRWLLLTCLLGLLAVYSRAARSEEEPAPFRESFVANATHAMYVQAWRPNPQVAPRGHLILVHGGSHTGTGWTTTPDGRPGWAFHMARAGWTVHVVDWPGVGRSGSRPENVNDTPADVVEILALLLSRTGPSVLMGHSIGGALAIKLTERMPESVRAVVALAPASVETAGNIVPAAPLDRLSGTTREGALQRFANSPTFPQEAFDSYFSSLVLYAPRIRNAAAGLSDDFKIDRSKAAIWKGQVPLLLLAAEEDVTVPPARMAQTAAALGVSPTMLGKDWGMPGHGHLFIVERGTDAIAEKVDAWLATRAKPQ